MVRCPRCAHETDTDFEICPVCGFVDTPVDCGRCGETFGGTDSCPACGKARWEIPCDTHPEAVAPGRCVICNRALCRDCNRGDNRTFFCVDHESVTVIQGWAQIYSTSREFEAQLLLGNLKAEGLDARIFTQRDQMISVDLGEFSIVRILVPAWDYEAGSRVIREHTDRSGEVAFACPTCGELTEPGAATCSACGSLLDTPQDSGFGIEDSG